MVTWWWLLAACAPPPVAVDPVRLAQVPPAPAGESGVVGAGDVDGDGDFDLLRQVGEDFVVATQEGGIFVDGAFVPAVYTQGVYNNYDTDDCANGYCFSYDVLDRTTFAGMDDLNADGFADVFAVAYELVAYVDHQTCIWTCDAYCLHCPDDGKLGVAIWLGGPGGLTFQGQPISVRSLGVNVQVAGDVDGDGLLDLLWHAEDGDVRFSGISGAFPGDEIRVRLPDPLGPNDWAPTAGDVNGDGLADLLERSDENEVSVRLSLPGAALDDLLSPTPVVASLPPVLQPELYGGDPAGTWVQGVGDLDGDGMDDLASITEGARPVVDVVHGAPGGLEPTPRGAYRVASTDRIAPGAVAGADVDGDGVRELVVLVRDSAGRTLLLQYEAGSGDVLPEAAREVPSQLFGKVVRGLGDLDGDGAEDLLIGDQIIFGEVPACADGSVPGTWYLDEDGDGVTSSHHPGVLCSAPAGASSVPGGDCDDADPATWPGAPEDGVPVDRDCDGESTRYRDNDGDGFGLEEAFFQGYEAPFPYIVQPGDCDDRNAAAFPGGGADVIGGGDRDCDGDRLCFQDLDGDGLGGLTEEVVGTCDVAPYVRFGGDCDDADAAVGGPGFAALDVDGDGYAGPFYGLRCPTSEGVLPDDCDDADSAVSPGAVEVAGDRFDQDCDGEDPFQVMWRARDQAGRTELEVFVTGARRGAEVAVYGGVAVTAGAGPCVGVGPVCGDLTSPVLLGRGVADRGGRFTLRRTTAVAPAAVQAVSGWVYGVGMSEAATR